MESKFLPAATIHLGLMRTQLRDGHNLASTLLTLFAALLMLGWGWPLGPVVPLAICGVALLLLLQLRLVGRSSGLEQTQHPVSPTRARRDLRHFPAKPMPQLSPPPTVSRSPRPEAKSAASARVSRAATTARTEALTATRRAPLQGLAQSQGDHHFLFECRRHFALRWQGLVADMEEAWSRRDLGALRWALYQLRVQSTLWGVQPLGGEARALEGLLEHTGTVGFDIRCERALARLRALSEGRQEEVDQGLC
ncbi:MAG TPA: hypothetical protein DCY89_02480 [Gammaproteobacteria bacterium]|nr:hypothetical protein [Gammaproteobacteria bacterium]